MSFLFQSTPKVIPEFTGLQINTSVQALPVPIIWGSPRVNVNLIYYNGFNVKRVSQSSGKGVLSGGKGGNQQVEYFATIILAIGEGELGAIKLIYQDQGVYTTADYPSPGLNYFTGTSTQAPWSFVVANWPQDARPYKDDAYLAVANAQLDSSATVPQINMVIAGRLNASCPLNNTTVTISTGQYDSSGKAISFIGNINLGLCDADPAQVIMEFLTNDRFGAGFPPGLIDSAPGNSILAGPFSTDPNFGDASVQSYCQAVGFGWSVALNNVEQANSILERWTYNLTVAPVWTGELLKFIPYWDTPASGNPGYDSGSGIPLRYFTPNVTPLVRITLDHMLQSDNKDEEPISYSRVDPMLVHNTVRVDYRDRNNFFNDVPAEAKDEANIELYGPHIDNLGLAGEFSLNTYAQTAAEAILRRKISIRRTFKFRLGPLWAFLDPMDIIQIPDPVDWDNFINVRIVSAEDDENEITTYKAEEFPLGSASPFIVPPPTTTPPNQGATNVPPSPVFVPVIFEPTSDMLTATGFTAPQVIIGASGGTNDILDPNWGGCIINVSLDNAQYERVGSITGPSAIGRLATTLLTHIGGNPDNTNTLEVNMNESQFALGTFGNAAAAAGKSLCIVKDASGYELLSFSTATLVAGNTFNLTGLYRGLYGTTARQFNSGSQFLFLGTVNSFFETSLPSQYVGQTFFVKLQSFNVFGSATQDISTCVAYQYVVVGPVVPPVPPLPGPVPTSRRRDINRGENIVRRSTVRRKL